MTWCPIAVVAFILAVTVGFGYQVANSRTNGGAWFATLGMTQRVCGMPAGRNA